MANPSSSMDFLGMLRNKLEEAPPVALREIVSSTIQLLMSAETDALCGADYGERSDERIDSRKGLGVSTRRVETLVQRGHGHRHRGQRRGATRDPGRGRVHRRGRRRLDDLPTWPGGAGSSWHL